jgi:hypothetical protein
MSYHLFVNNFNAGELSPFLRTARTSQNIPAVARFGEYAHFAIGGRALDNQLAKRADVLCRLIGLDFSVARISFWSWAGVTFAFDHRGS